MQRGNIKKAIKVITNNMSGGVLPLNDETLDLLVQKHPEATRMSDDAILQGPIMPTNPIVYGEIDDNKILKAAKITEGGSGPSGMDADGWRKILVSRVYGETGSDLRKAFAETVKKICIENVSDDSLEAFTACRLVPLDKCPGLRPIGVGEVLRRIAGKVVMFIAKNDVMDSSSNIQMCSGHEAGSEAAIHSMKDMFEKDDTEAVLLVDAANAFNSINREAILHNIRILCPILATYVTNCYKIPARLFVIGGREIKSKEGTTQGDPLGMAIYAIGLTPMLEELKNFNIIMVAFADDLTAVGTFDSLRSWWDNLMKTGPIFGYHPQPTKSWLIVKDARIGDAKRSFNGSNVQLTSAGKRHLGAVIGSGEFRNSYCKEIVDEWVKEIGVLAEVAVTEPQAAYTCFISGYQHKFTYFLRTIPHFDQHLKKLEEVIKHRLLPAILGGHIVTDQERKLLALPPRLGGMGIKIPYEYAEFEYQCSRKVTKALVQQIVDENQPDENDVKQTKYKIKAERSKLYDDKLHCLELN